MQAPWFKLNHKDEISIGGTKEPNFEVHFVPKISSSLHPKASDQKLGPVKIMVILACCSLKFSYMRFFSIVKYIFNLSFKFMFQILV